MLYRDGRCRRCWAESHPLFRVVDLDTGEVRFVNDAWLRRELGRAKGAAVIHSRGLAHQWSPKTARAAALKRWKQTPVNRRIGVRLGLAISRKKPKAKPLIKRIVRIRPVKIGPTISTSGCGGDRGTIYAPNPPKRKD